MIRMIEEILYNIVNGLVIGGIYSLMAVGLSLIFGIMDLVNFAHGEFFMIGAYCGYFIATSFGLDPISSAFGAMAIGFALGVLVEKLCIYPLRVKFQKDGE